MASLLWLALWHHCWVGRPPVPAFLPIQVPGAELKAVTNFTHNADMDPAHVAVDASVENTLPHTPNGYILSYGVSYKAVQTEGTSFDQLPACPPSATATHDAFVSKCGFSSSFVPILDDDATKSRMIADVRRVATTVASHDVVVLFFSGHGKRMEDTACVVDAAGCVVSVRKLQAVFAETVMERGLCDVAFIVILDCCQESSRGKLLPLEWMLPEPVFMTWRVSLSVCVSGTGVADPSDDPVELDLCVADAHECSWFVGFATSPSALAQRWRWWDRAADCVANDQIHQLSRDTKVI